MQESRGLSLWCEVSELQFSIVPVTARARRATPTEKVAPFFL